MPQSSQLVLQASRGAIFQVESDGNFLALPTPTGPPVFGVTLEQLRIFTAFAQPRTIPEARARIEAERGCPDFDAHVQNLMTWGLLTVHDTPRGHDGGFGHIESHIPMVADGQRVRAYADAIRAHVRGRTVAELGCGTGILSLLAAQAGARSVWAVEESDIATIAEELLQDHRRAGRVEIVRANSFDVEPPEPVDVLVHELFGVDPLEENILSIIDDARRRWLRPGGRLLPMAFSIHACAVGGEAWSVGSRSRDQIRTLAQDLGIDLNPILQAGAEAPLRRIDPPTVRPTEHELLSESITLAHVDLASPTSIFDQSRHRLPVRRDGSVGAILMWFDIHLDEHRTLSASPFSAPTHWHWQVWDLPEPIPVSTGQSLDVRIELHTVDGCPQVDVLDVRHS